MFNTLIEKLKARLNPSKEKIEGTEGKQQPRVRIERGTTK